MILYFEFDERTVNAEVQWSKDLRTISVHITDPRLNNEMPSDLLFDILKGNQISFIVENPDNKRLVHLQKVISRRLQEFVNKS
jgi:uncharacterized protein (DUF779 family)